MMKYKSFSVFLLFLMFISLISVGFSSWTIINVEYINADVKIDSSDVINYGDYIDVKDIHTLNFNKDGFVGNPLNPYQATMQSKITINMSELRKTFGSALNDRNIKIVMELVAVDNKNNLVVTADDYKTMIQSDEMIKNSVTYDQITGDIPSNGIKNGYSAANDAYVTTIDITNLDDKFAFIMSYDFNLSSEYFQDGSFLLEQPKFVINAVLSIG